MRIKLKTNSNISLPEHLSNINLDYGYSIGPKQEAVSPWKDKLASKVDTVLSLFNPLNTEQKQIIISVTEAAKFLDSHFPKESTYLDDMQIQINVKSSLNMVIKKIANVMSSYYPETGKRIGEIVNFDKAFINSAIKKIAIGTEVFKEQLSSSNFAHDLKTSIGLKNAVNHAIYHEASHSSQRINDKIFGNKYDQKFNDLLTTAKKLTDDDDYLKYIELELFKLKNLDAPKINKSLMHGIVKLNKEIYADIGGILLQRNQDIISNDYSSSNTLHIIDSVISARDKEDIRLRKNYIDEMYFLNFHHFTSPGLEYLKEKYHELPNSVLTQKEIHDISNKAIEQGISKFLIATCFSNVKGDSEVNLLFVIAEKDKKSEPKSEKDIIKELLGIHSIDLSDIDMNKSNKAGIKNLKFLAGENWDEKFRKNLESMKGLMVDSNSLWYAAFHQKEFDNELVQLRDNKFEQQHDIEQVAKSVSNMDNLLDKLRSNSQPKNTQCINPN